MHGDHGTHVAGDRHGDAQRMPITIRQALLDLSRMLGERAPACAGIHDETVALLRRRGRTDVGARTETRVYQRSGLGAVNAITATERGGVSQVNALKRAQRLLVDVEPPRLVYRLSIPVQSQPCQIVHDPAVRVRQHARGVDVLDAQQHAPSPAVRIAWIGCATHAIHAIHVIQAIRIARSTARPACTLWATRTSRQPRTQHRIHVTDMHSSGRCRRESSDHHRAQSSESSGHSLIVQPRNDIDCCCISGAGSPACWHTVSLSRWSSR